MEILGYIAAVLMGMTLGVIGGGGSILTVPILVYLMGTSPVMATGYSLLVVGTTAAFGTYRYYIEGLIPLKPALQFAIPSIIAVYLTRAFLMPVLPENLITLPSGMIISKDFAIMVLFATLMILAALMMLRDSSSTTKEMEPRSQPYPMIVLEGAVVGTATGILGAGGGFLIIPALVLLMGMPMKQAVGASLLIIALKSLIGFIGDLQSGIEIRTPMLMFFMGATLAGMWVATRVSKEFDNEKLQKIFAWFTLIVAAIILFKELS